MSLSRRQLLHRGGQALVAGGMLSTLRGMQAMPAQTLLAPLPPSDYRALVVLFLAGGNDSFNLVAPRDTAGHGVYAASRGNLAVPQENLLPISPQSGGDSRQWGLHPSLPGLRTLFESGQLAIVGNIGTLLQPMTKAQYQGNGASKPAHLFSHSDQTTLWQLPSARDDVPHGWGGRMADLLLAMNGSSPLSPAITIAGSARLLRGQTVVPYSLGTNGSIALSGMSGTRGTRRLQTLRNILAHSHGQAMERQFAGLHNQAIDLDSLIRTALAGAPTLATTFPTSTLAAQLQMVAKMLSVRQQLGAARQVFFVRQGGYDTHDNQLLDQPRLFQALSEALVAFHAATVELGIDQQVTTCTLSEFGRTLSSNGRGSDHGWGGNQLVLGGAVQGRRIYGTMPDLALGGPDDVGAGRMLPTTAVEQMAATLATWFGVPGGQLGALFPRLSQFAAPNLGFMT